MKPVALVLAAFGTSQPQALKGITRVLERVRESFPQNPVALSFTSNQIRSRWRRRLHDQDWHKHNADVPTEVLSAKGPLAAIANFQDAGYQRIVVQPLHIYAGEEYEDLKSYVSGLNSIQTIKPKWMPFKRLLIGRPALGAPGIKHPYMNDIQRAAQALEIDVQAAREIGAALVYVGHGNHVFSTGVYHELRQVILKRHPDVVVEIGAVEGLFDATYVADRLRKQDAGRVLLKPLMLVAGVHAMDDMAGDDDDSWRSTLTDAGFDVQCRMHGLGESEAWAGIYIQNIIECAADAGIKLKDEVTDN